MAKTIKSKVLKKSKNKDLDNLLFYFCIWININLRKKEITVKKKRWLLFIYFLKIFQYIVDGEVDESFTIF